MNLRGQILLSLNVRTNSYGALYEIPPANTPQPPGQCECSVTTTVCVCKRLIQGSTVSKVIIIIHIFLIHLSISGHQLMQNYVYITKLSTIYLSRKILLHKRKVLFFFLVPKNEKQVLFDKYFS